MKRALHEQRTFVAPLREPGGPTGVLEAQPQVRPPALA